MQECTKTRLARGSTLIPVAVRRVPTARKEVDRIARCKEPKDERVRVLVPPSDAPHGVSSADAGAHAALAGLVPGPRRERSPRAPGSAARYGRGSCRDKREGQLPRRAL